MVKRLDVSELKDLQARHPEDTIRGDAEPIHGGEAPQTVVKPEPLPNNPVHPTTSDVPPDGTIISGGEWKPEALTSEPDRDLYWGCVTLDSPASYFTPGARTITKFSGGFKVENGVACFHDKVGRGSVFSATPDEIAQVQHEIEGFVLRPTGNGGADRISIKGRRKAAPDGKLVVVKPFLRGPNDVPLGWFCCIVKIPSKNAIPEWDELEIRRRTYFKRPPELIEVDLFAPEEEAAPAGFLKSQEDAFNAMLPPEAGPRPVKYPAAPKKRIGNVVIEKA